MERIVSVLPAKHGRLYARMRGKRYLLAECEAEIELIEHVEDLAVLGRGRVIKSRDVCLLITFRHELRFDADIGELDGLDFVGEVLRQDGRMERVELFRCYPLDEWDLTEAGECRFEAAYDRDLLRRLRTM